jgi:hypothetical protein
VVLQIHLAVPQTRNLVVDLAGLLVLDRPRNGVVRAGEVALGLELDVAHEVVLGALDEAVVAELVLHFSEQDAAGVHVGLRQDAIFFVSLALEFFNTDRSTYYRSPLTGSFPRFNSRKTAVPSIRLAAELPRNLLRGLSVPSILI